MIRTPKTLLLLSFLALSAAAYPRLNVRASVSSNWDQANAASGASCMSADGRYVAFASTATNLVPGDTNGKRDIFVFDRNTGTTRRINLSSGGAQANDDADLPDLSGNGRYCVYESTATNLVAGDTNGERDIFRTDLQTGTTVRVSVSDAEAQADNWSKVAKISDDGTRVAFGSAATNLVSGDTNGYLDVFVRNISAGTTTMMSVSDSGAVVTGSKWVMDISGDGNVVSFESPSASIVAGDTNGATDVFVHPSGGTTQRASVGSGGQADGHSFGGALSYDGTVVVFSSQATNLVPGDTNGKSDVFRRNLVLGSTDRDSLLHDGSQLTNDSDDPTVDSTGTLTIYHYADGNIYRRLASQPGAYRVSVENHGNWPDAPSTDPACDGTGYFVSFTTNSTNLTPRDTNGVADIVVAKEESPTGGPDIAIVRTAAPKNLGAYLMSNGNITGWRTISSSTSWTPVAVGHFAPSTYMDGVVLQQPGTNKLGFWSWNGNTITGYMNLLTLPANWELVAVADLDANTYGDLIVRNTVTRAICAYMMVDGKVVGWRSIVTPPAAWKPVLVEDLDFDGRYDLLVMNTTTRQLGAYLLDGHRIAGWKSILTMPANWEPRGLGPYGSGGFTDLLVENTVTRKLGAYQTYGGTIVGWKSIGSMPAGYQIVGTGFLH